MARKHKKKKDQKDSKDGDIKVTTMATSKFVIDKDGKRMEYSSIEEMPPDVRRFHEQVQAFIDGKPSELLEFREGPTKITTTTKTTYRYKGKNYHKIDDIPDEKTRAMFRAIKEQSFGKSPESIIGKKILITQNGRMREVCDVSEKIWCPGCGNKIIPIKTFLGKYKCPQCKMKWRHGELV